MDKYIKINHLHNTNIVFISVVLLLPKFPHWNLLSIIEYTQIQINNINGVSEKTFLNFFT